VPFLTFLEWFLEINYYFRVRGNLFNFIIIIIGLEYSNNFIIINFRKFLFVLFLPFGGIENILIVLGIVPDHFVLVPLRKGHG
jgi:hypothetical protein